ncbi:DNA ligase [Micractinium conductrix]|uniref:DNA ligase n=1 Tax=Micractinium conductrix TaxID=554055 RepID=A0A2P6V7L2_9CHLO|nr:DNA ligase [Micractinium conductrix]|eukprot:PSC70071.1 DNA ligase [Micractinium conductrix]
MATLCTVLAPQACQLARSSRVRKATIATGPLTYKRPRLKAHSRGKPLIAAATGQAGERAADAASLAPPPGAGAAPPPAPVPVSFVVPHCKLAFGEGLRLLDSAVQLPPGEHSFKLVITRADGSVHWEEGGDRRLCVPELAAGAAARPLLHATCWRFGDTGATGVEVDRQQLQAVADAAAARVADLTRRRAELAAQLEHLEAEVVESEARIAAAAADAERVASVELQRHLGHGLQRQERMEAAAAAAELRAQCRGTGAAAAAAPPALAPLLLSGVGAGFAAGTTRVTSLADGSVQFAFATTIDVDAPQASALELAKGRLAAQLPVATAAALERRLHGMDRISAAATAAATPAGPRKLKFVSAAVPAAGLAGGGGQRRLAARVSLLRREVAAGAAQAADLSSDFELLLQLGSGGGSGGGSKGGGAGKPPRRRARVFNGVEAGAAAAAAGAATLARPTDVDEPASSGSAAAIPAPAAQSAKPRLGAVQVAAPAALDVTSRASFPAAAAWVAAEAVCSAADLAWTFGRSALPAAARPAADAIFWMAAAAAASYALLASVNAAHKLIPGCGFLVDGFLPKHAAHPSVKAYFLSHAHSDHYTGLKDDWQRGPIYCSEVTARLIAHMLGVQRRLLVPLQLDTPTTIQGVEVTLVDANHCPGAVQFLFRLPSGARYIHTGDMRFSPALLHNPHLRRFRGCDALFLDTTYCRKRHVFPPQEESIEYVASTVRRLLHEDAAPRAAGHGAQQGQQQAQQAQQGEDTEGDGSDGEGEQGHLPRESSERRLDSEPQRQQDVQQEQQGQEQQQEGEDSDGPASSQGGDAAAAAAPACLRGRFRRLVLVATYGIGKERLLTAVHDRCGVQLCVADKKHAVMQKLDLPGYDPAQLFTTDAAATAVHVVQWGFLGETWPYFRPNFTKMEEYRQRWGAEEVVGFVPTGWLYEMKKQTFSVRRKGACSVHLVPYSEHSSWSELQEYVRFLRPQQVIPTVGVDGADADRARERMQKEFRLLVDETASKAKFLGLFQRGGSSGGGGDCSGGGVGAAGGAAGGGAGGAGKEAAVPADAMALPLDKYQPEACACWAPGEPAPYLHLARALELMDGTTKRLHISDVLTNCFRSLVALRPRGELAAAAYLACGRIAPDYEPGAELNVGGSTVASAIMEATGASKEHISELYKRLGDLGDVAQALKRGQALLARPAPLTLPGVLATLRQIAAEKGQGSKGRRQRLVLSLLRACRESETKFIVRTLVQALRVGASWRTVIPALGKAAVLHRAAVPPADGQALPKAQLDAAAAAATAAFHVCPNMPQLINCLLDHPPEEWQVRCPLMPGVPIKPMLAKPCEGTPDALRQLKGAPFVAEWKYDGVRAQVHLDAAAPPQQQVAIFSRNSEDKTAAFPDVAQHALAAMAGGATSAIIDAEVVAVELGEDGSISRLRAFQELAGRQKVEVVASSVKVPVCIFAFDLLYRDGQSLAGLPLAERRSQLRQAFPATRPGRFVLAQGQEYPGGGAAANDGGRVAPGAAGERLAEAPGGAQQQEGQHSGDIGEDVAAAADAAQAGQGSAALAGRAWEAGEAGGAAAAGDSALEERLQESLLEAFAAGAEGLVLKSLTSPYEPSRRSDHWLKLKRDYIAGMSDSLDLVPIGAWWGNGRKAGWFSPFLLACYDPESEELQSVCRVMSGFSDAFYREATERLGATVIEGPRQYYRTGEQPSVWFDAQEVWEIRGADLTISPLHKAAVGRVQEDRGISLRFPRFLRIRDDKAPEDATTAEQVAQLFHSQTRKADTAGQRLAQKRAALAPPGEAPRPPSAVTNVPGDRVSSSQINADLSKAVSAATGKPEAYVMVSFEPGKAMIFGGTEEPCAYGELISIGAIGGEKNKKISTALAEVVQRHLGVPSSRFYIKFYDVSRSDFGWSGTTF